MKKAICLILSMMIMLTSIPVFSSAADDNFAINKEDALHADGYKIVNTKGEDVFLKGINLGGWLIMEDWFCPVNNDATGDVYTYEWVVSKTNPWK